MTHAQTTGAARSGTRDGWSKPKSQRTRASRKKPTSGLDPTTT